MAAPADPLARLLAQEGWLRRLARGLVADGELADDLVQETWARVLRRPPGELEAPRAWLALLARRVAGERRREERARRAREQQVAAERGEAVDERRFAEQVEAAARVQRALAQAVLALDEPARSTIVLRYFEGRSAARIARETGVPASTVRNRLRRARAELRALLDRESGGDRGRWLGALVPLAAGRAPLGAAEAGAARLFDLLSLARPAAAFLVMGSPAKLALAGAVALLALLPLALRRSQSPSPAPATPPAERHAPRIAGGAEEGGGTARRSADPAPAAAEREPIAAPPAAPEPLAAGVLEVLVLRTGGAAETPVTEGRVWLGLQGVFLPRDPEGGLELAGASPAGAAERTRVTTLDRDGRARFLGVPAGPRAVGVELPGAPILQAHATVPSGAGARLVLRVGSGRIHGSVHEPAGGQAAGARVQISAAAERAGEVHCVLWTDELGRYDARHLPEGEYGIGVDLGGVQDPKGADYAAMVQLAPGASLEHDFGTQEGLPVWRGQVLTRSGEPALRGVDWMPGRIHLTRTDEWSYGYHAWRADGSFEIPLEPGTYDVHLSAPGRGERQLALEGLVVTEGASGGGVAVERDLVLAGATVTGRAARGKWVSLRPGPDAPPSVAVALSAGGRYRIDGVPAGTWWLTLDERTILRAQELHVREDDQRIELDLR